MGYEKDKVDEETPIKKRIEKDEKKEQIVVVKELPVQTVRQSTDEETGIVTTFVTIEEALTNLIGGKL